MTQVQLGDFSQQIYSALEIRSPQDSINAVKKIVIKELETLDTSVVIRDTTYFNHTFAPDLILKWEEQPERPVYLRFTDNLAEMRDGIAKIDLDDPFVFGLNSPPQDAKGFPELETAAQENRALITDAEGIETLIDRRKDDVGVDLFSQAISRGGRGLLTRPQVEVVTQFVSEGFSGALETKNNPTRAAVNTIAQYLDEPQAARMTRVLQAVWEGSDGRIDQFPGPADLSRGLSSESLQYILDVVSANDREFWRRIGRALTTQQLAQIKTSTSNMSGFQNLINSNLDVIRCRAAAVVSTNATLDSDGSFLWTVRGNTLALEGSDFTAFVSDRKATIEDKSRGTHTGVDVETISRRASRMKLSEVMLRDGDASVQFMSNVGVGHDERLAKLAKGLSTRSKVEKAVILVPDGQLALNFKNGIVNAKTKGTPLMVHVLATAIPLLHEIDEETHNALDKFLHVETPTAPGSVDDLLSLLAETIGEDPPV